MKSGKSKLISIIFAFILCLGALSFGVFAALSASLTSNGSVTFNAYGIDVDVDGSITGAVGTGITTIYSGTTNKTRQPSKNLISSTPWNFGNLGFDEENAMSLSDLVITFKFKITNYSNFAIEASATVPSINGIVIEKEDLIYSYNYDSTLGADKRYVTVTLKPASLEKPVSLSNLTLTLNISKTLKQETDISKFIWGTPANGTISLTGNNLTSLDIEIVIPKMYGANKITTIGNKAFMECYSLEKVVIPATVISIENGFYGFKIKAATYAPEEREHGAFLGCSRLKSIFFPDSLTEIGENAFYNCNSINNITIPASVNSIGPSAFYNCSSLTKIIIPASVSIIGFNSFYYCSSLTNITIPASVSIIGSNAFRYCSALLAIKVDSGNTNYSSDNGVLLNKNKTTVLMCPQGKTSYIIPSTVTSIGSSAFETCTKLTNVTIGSGVTSIGSSAFRYCSALESVYFERVSVFSSLGSSCFSSLKSGSKLYFKNNTVMNQFTTSHYDSSTTSKALY